jgi:hypothetical protein
VRLVAELAGLDFGELDPKRGRVPAGESWILRGSRSRPAPLTWEIGGPGW